ncbi:NADH:flavin oxidoreductase [Actinosynnema pretiosum]|uniref:12-oxophytodienoate reductase n=1 Tax=Actinosynnema pretiosum TaxID=42197 RepID=A0A290Z984_9PSEU|nr:NADH:flavin oxidoreductase [Actinosynnema pretiosum]ATE55529.1 12-oxophytodienoate reductase [Actinosynnema pretiosum]
MTGTHPTDTDPTDTPARGAEALFRPYRLGPLRLPNRVVMAPMTREHSPDGVPGEDVARYYARHAAGGVGLIITEGVYLDDPASGPSSRTPRMHGDAALAGWRRVTGAVHAEGVPIVAQLWHVGAAPDASHWPVADFRPVTPSGVGPDGQPLTEPHTVLDQRGIDTITASYARAAAAAEGAGFDGVELHAAHGYLIDQFLWSVTNRRTDAYGGDAVARTRFAAEVIAAVRAAVSPDFPVFLRISQWKGNAYDAKLADDPAALGRVLAPLVAAGVDVFHASTRRYWEPEFPGSDLNLAGWIKRLTGRPVVTVGSVGLDLDMVSSLSRPGEFGENKVSNTGIEPLLRRLERDEFDLVAVGRALLADPEWPRKVRAGRADEVAPFDPSALFTLG